VKGLLFSHAICISLVNATRESYRLGLSLTVSSSLFAITSAAQLASRNTLEQETQTTTLLSVANISVATALGLASAALPRRPDVVYNKRLVDRQWTVSMLSRCTWSWFEPWHHHAAKFSGFASGDIPQANAGLRSAELTYRGVLLEGQTLVWCLARLYRGRLALLWSITLLRCVVSVLPFLTLYNVLSVLQDETTDFDGRQISGAICLMAAFALIDSVRHFFDVESPVELIVTA
jgi:hypothetical protein